MPDACKCGKALVGYQYPRPGPAPGFWLVCPDPECDGSVEAMRRRLDAQVAAWPTSPSASTRASEGD